MDELLDDIGRVVADIVGVEECLRRLGQLVSDLDRISELDINPLRVFHQGEGVRTLDARVILE